MELKRGVLNGENIQNGNFLLCRPETLNVLCSRPVTAEEEIVWGYDNDDVKATHFHLELIVDVVRLSNCVNLPPGVHADTLFVLAGALRLKCLNRHYHGRGVRFKVLCHLTEVIDCEGKSFAWTCFHLRAKVNIEILKQQRMDARRKVSLYHCLESIKCFYEEDLKSEKRTGRAKVGGVGPRALLESMYLKLLKEAGFQGEQLPSLHTIGNIIKFVMAIDPLALKNLTCAPVSDKRFNFMFDVA